MGKKKAKKPSSKPPKPEKPPRFGIGVSKRDQKERRKRIGND